MRLVFRMGLLCILPVISAPASADDRLDADYINCQIEILVMAADLNKAGKLIDPGGVVKALDNDRRFAMQLVDKDGHNTVVMCSRDENSVQLGWSRIYHRKASSDMIEAYKKQP